MRAALRCRGDGPTKKEIRERIVYTGAGRRAFRISAREASERIERPIDPPEPDGPFGWRCRVWHADAFHWRLGGPAGPAGSVLASNGRTPSGLLPPGIWGAFGGIAWGGSREDDRRWFDLANDPYWTFYGLRTDEICGISHELRPWPSRWTTDELFSEDTFASREPLPWR